MAKNLRDLAMSMQRLDATIKKNANFAKMRSASSIVAFLTIKGATPVDTSNAISNWQVSLDVPTGAIRDPYFAGLKGSTGAESAEAAYAASGQMIMKAQPGKSLWIVNNVPYIEKLDNGSSMQAPSGFSAAAVIIGREAIKNFKLTK